MVIREYPEEIKKLMDIYEPYAQKIYHGATGDVPPNAIKAYNQVKEWAWSQGQ